MTKTEGLLDTNKLESLELKMGPEEFSKLMYFFIIEVKSSVKEIEKSADTSDFDNIMKLTRSLKKKPLTVGAVLFGEKIIKVESACIKGKKEELLESVKDMKQISEKTLDSLRDILLITFCLYSCHKEKDHTY